MIQLVHWHDCVGSDFLDTFVSIAKDITYAERRGDTETVINRLIKDKPDQYATYETKRSMMLFCGYESEVVGNHRLFYRTGWYGLPEIEGDELKYRFMSRLPYHPTPEFISLRTFLDMKREQREQDDEEKYYNYGRAKSYIKRAVNDGFIREEE